MSEQDVPCPDPNEVVTRAILREELTKELANYPTKEDLRNELAKFATREEVGLMIGAVVEASEQRIRADFTQLVRGIEETLLGRIGGLLDPYRDYPERIANHEGRIVRLETPKPAKRRVRPIKRKRR